MFFSTMQHVCILRHTHPARSARNASRPTEAHILGSLMWFFHWLEHGRRMKAARRYTPKTKGVLRILSVAFHCQRILLRHA